MLYLILIVIVVLIFLPTYYNGTDFHAMSALAFRLYANCYLQTRRWRCLITFYRDHCTVQRAVYDRLHVYARDEQGCVRDDQVQGCT